MTLDDLLSRLEGVRQHGRGWLAKCPAHPDKNPSLSIHEGERGLLVKCWAHCSLQEICLALGITIKDLFFDSSVDHIEAKKLRAQRARERRRKATIEAAAGLTIDALREADSFIRSRQGLDISNWSQAHLHAELNALADAYTLLEHEDLDGLR